MKKIVEIILLLTLIPSNLFADRQGNGGDAVVCYDLQNPSVVVSAELLDVFEGREERGIQMDLGSDALSFEEKISFALDRIASLDPERARAYGERAAEFFSESRFVNAVLQDIPDHGYLRIKPDPRRGCFIEQVAVRDEPLIPEDHRFLIDQKIWDQMDNDNKAALVLHEIVFEENLKQRSHKNSILTRYYVSMLVSDMFSQMDQQAYDSKVRLSGMGDDQYVHNSTVYHFPGVKLSFQKANRYCQETAGGIELYSPRRLDFYISPWGSKKFRRYALQKLNYKKRHVFWHNFDSVSSKKWINIVYASYNDDEHWENEVDIEGQHQSKPAFFVCITRFLPRTEQN